MTVESWPQFTVFFSMEFCLLHTSRQAVFSFITNAEFNKRTLVNRQNPKNPSGFFLHVCLCYPGHVLLGLKVTVVLLQLTTARAAGHGGRTLPGPSLGQQEGLAVLVTCPPHSTAFCTKGKSLSPKTH